MFVYNYVLTSAIVGWALAQIIKTVLHSIKMKNVHMERLIGSGGMPSSHTSMVIGALVSVSRKTGVQSCEFAIMFIVAAVVMYDAMNVRWAAGLHAKEINRINRITNYFEDINWDINDPPESLEADLHRQNKKELQEYLGHTPLEVLGGLLLGIIIAMALPVD